MGVALESNAVFVGIEYLAIFVWGLSGGLSAIRKGFDLFSILTCAWVTALGGGLVRDVLLGDLPPVGITDKGYILTCLVSGLIVAVAHPEIRRMRWTMDVIDALGLGLFAVNGTAKALAFGSSGVTAVFLGMFTALAGGLFRDVMLGEVPMIIRDRHLYAVPSFVGCILTVLVDKGVHAGVVSSQAEMVLDVAVVAVVVAMRMLSVACDLTFPGAVRRDDSEAQPSEIQSSETQPSGTKSD
ncbi:hypothetical protein G1C96_0211 [Bifidobacterium sp. DSM 109958]|uniref:Glycine transporter domain-containing protein n=1 Tax=Bifidobacterium moraviense TaxID=2675323 RepID=A0A7Y0HYC8_9BIFI|nr:hypothetical protein [Bifidobacterium sp. DSM 109958]